MPAAHPPRSPAAVPAASRCLRPPSARRYPDRHGAKRPAASPPSTWSTPPAARPRGRPRRASCTRVPRFRSRPQPRAGLDDADQGAPRQPPAPHALVVVPVFHLREHGPQGIAQPLGRPASDLQLGCHFVERQTGAACRQVTSKPQQPLRGFVAHHAMLPAPGRHRNHSPVPGTKPMGRRRPIRPSHSAARRRSSVAGSDILPVTAARRRTREKSAGVSVLSPSRPAGAVVPKNAGRPASPVPWSSNRTAA